MQDRLEIWRIDTGRSEDGNNDECSPPVSSNGQSNSTNLSVRTASDSIASAITATATATSTRPQHSLAKSIFRRQNIDLQVFDSGYYVDGDVVDVLLNGVTIRSNLRLTGPGTPVPLTLKASALLSTKVNKLVFHAVRTGSLLEPKVTVGVNILLKNAHTIVQGGPKIDVTPIVTHVTDLTSHNEGITPGNWSDPLDIALGMVCYDPYDQAQPESTQHARDALAGKADKKGIINSARIVTIDRLGATSRRRNSTAAWPTSSVTQNDEYPPAIFLENGGKGHVEPIKKSDNLSFGGYLVGRITGAGGTANPMYLNGDQVELIVAPRAPGHGSLYCKNAW